MLPLSWSVLWRRVEAGGNRRVIDDLLKAEMLEVLRANDQLKRERKLGKVFLVSYLRPTGMMLPQHVSCFQSCPVYVAFCGSFSPHLYLKMSQCQEASVHMPLDIQEKSNNQVESACLLIELAKHNSASHSLDTKKSSRVSWSAPQKWCYAIVKVRYQTGGEVSLFAHRRLLCAK